MKIAIFPTSVYSTPQLRGFLWNFVTVLVLKKLEGCPYQRSKKFDDMFIYLDTVPAFCRQTDRHGGIGKTTSCSVP